MYITASGIISALVVFFGLSACARSPMTTTTEPTSPWVQVWSDEFDGGAIDPARWVGTFDCSGGGNKEAQCYTTRRENVFVDNDGMLHIVAREESFSGRAYEDDLPQFDSSDTSVTRSYTSAKIHTRNLFDFKYGRIEVRARLPGGQGMWPAIWMLPTEQVYGGWPSSGEIDIMEAVNLDTAGAPNEVHGSMNYGLKWPQWSTNGTRFESPRSLTRNFHTFVLEWEADEIRWFIDGIHYATQTSAGWYNYIWGNQQTGFSVANPRAPYDQKFYLLLNLAVGGHWAGQPDRNWRGDREFLVDYVRVFQCGSGNTDGTGCASAADAPIDTSIEVTADAGAPRINRFTLFADGPATLALNTGDKPVTNTLVIDNREEAAGNVLIDTPDIGGEHGEVLDISFTGPARVFLSSANMSKVKGVSNGFSLAGGTAWSTHGTLEFDLFIKSIDSATTLIAGLDSGQPDSRQYAIETPPAGEWSHVAIRVSDLLGSSSDSGKGIDLNNVTNLMVIAATGNSTASIRLDNISLSCAVNPLPKRWQWDTACSIEPLLSAE